MLTPTMEAVDNIFKNFFLTENNLDDSIDLSIDVSKTQKRKADTE